MKMDKKWVEAFVDYIYDSNIGFNGFRRFVGKRGKQYNLDANDLKNVHLLNRGISIRYYDEKGKEQVIDLLVK